MYKNYCCRYENTSTQRRENKSYRQLKDWRYDKKNWLFKNKKSYIERFHKIDLTFNLNGVVENFVPVASYNWALQSTPDKPVIIVPGVPDYLKENLICQKLERCKFQRICDENQYYASKHPMEPMLQAVLLCTPEYDFNSVDLITDRFNLRKLFDFIEGNSRESFRIDIQMNENGTLMFIRNDENIVLPCDDYSIEFKNKFTENGLIEAGSYWEIITYMLGSLRVMCQAQVDCVEKKSCLMHAELMPIKKEPIAFNENSNLFYIEGGQSSDQNNKNLIKLTTRGVYKGFPQNKWSHLLFFNIDIMVLGWHKTGLFKKIENISFEEVSKRCDRKKEEYGPSLGKLYSLIMLIKEKIINWAENKRDFAVVFDCDNDRHSLELFTVCNSSYILPDELKVRVFK